MLGGLGVMGGVAAFVHDIYRGSDSFMTGLARQLGWHGCIGAAGYAVHLVLKTLSGEIRACKVVTREDES